MAKARAIVKRRKAVRNIKKITKTMQMIATAKFQKSLKRAVGTKLEVHWRKPRISRGQKLNAVGGGLGVECDAVGMDDFAMDQVARRLADEEISAKLVRQGVAAIDIEATRRGELAGVEVGRGPGANDGEHARRFRRLGHVVNHRRNGHERVTFQVPVLEHRVHGRVSVTAYEAIAIVVEREAELTASGNGLALAGNRVEAKVPAADR